MPSYVWWDAWGEIQMDNEVLLNPTQNTFTHEMKKHTHIQKINKIHNGEMKTNINNMK